MAKSSINSTMFFYMALLLSFLLIVSVAESRVSFGRSSSLIGKATIECDSVYGAIAGDTCLGVEKMFSLTTEFFNSINPNLNCTALFVGQWLCVDGSNA